MTNTKDNKLIKQLGLQKLSQEEQMFYLEQFDDALRVRSGMALEDSLTDEQLTELARLSETAGDEQVETWLKQAIPNGEDIIDAEEAGLIAEIQQSAAQIRRVIHEHQPA